MNFYITSSFKKVIALNTLESEESKENKRVLDIIDDCISNLDSAFTKTDDDFVEERVNETILDLKHLKGILQKRFGGGGDTN